MLKNTLGKIWEKCLSFRQLSFCTCVSKCHKSTLCHFNGSFYFFFVFVFSVQPTLHPEMSSKDKTAKEGDTVELVCNVSGIPHPNVTWYRKSINGKKPKEREYVSSSWQWRASFLQIWAFGYKLSFCHCHRFFFFWFLFFF